MTIIGASAVFSGKGPTRPWKIFVGSLATAARLAEKSSAPQEEPSSRVTYHSPEMGMPPAQKSERKVSARFVIVPPDEMPPTKTRVWSTGHFVATHLTMASRNFESGPSSVFQGSPAAPKSRPSFHGFHVQPPLPPVL